MIGIGETSDPAAEVKAAIVAISRVMGGGTLDWMDEPLVEISSWNKAIAKQVEAENRS